MQQTTRSQLRDIAEKESERGVLTSNYSAEIDKVFEQLNSAFATEIICSLRYKSHYYKAKALGVKQEVGNHFLEHADQEKEHADRIAERITQLGKQPDMSPSAIIKNSHIEYKECNTISEMIRENLLAERIAVTVYRDFVRYLSMHDPVTRILIEDILAVEEAHADDMVELMTRFC